MTKLSQYGTEYTLADRGNASSYPVGCVCVCGVGVLGVNKTFKRINLVWKFGCKRKSVPQRTATFY